MRFGKIVASGLLGAALLGFSGGAHAAFIVQSGNNPGGTDNIISNACVGTITGPAAMVQGCLQSDHNTIVDFSSTTDNLTISGGQATLAAADSIINQLTIGLDTPGATFGKLIIDIQKTNNRAATISFSATPNSGLGPFVFNLGNGSNFFTITGEDFSSVSFTTSVTTGVLNLEVKQVRLGDVTTPTPVPEPATMALFGLGLAGLGVVTRRRRRDA